MHVRLLPNKRNEILRFHYHSILRRRDSFAFGKNKKNSIVYRIRVNILHESRE